MKWSYNFALEEGLLVYLTLAKFQTLAKCIPLKVTYLSYRKETEQFGRREGEILVKKGCKEGGGSCHVLKKVVIINYYFISQIFSLSYLLKVHLIRSF